MKLYANLHLHSTHSDGGYAPNELVRIAKKEGYRAIALTDHDTVSGWSEFKEACQKEDMEYLCGTEFSVPGDSRFERGAHIVGFHFDPEYPEMKEYLKALGETATERAKGLANLAIEAGVLKGITWDEVVEFNKGVTWFCGVHVDLLLKAKGITAPEKNKFYREHKDEFASIQCFKTIEETIKLIHDAGGIAIVAHPSGSFGCLDYIDAFVEFGIDGMEVWHHDLNDEEQKVAYKIALEKNLYISGGSDHHGLCSYPHYRHEKDNRAYSDYCSAGTTKEYFEEIVNRKKDR